MPTKTTSSSRISRAAAMTMSSRSVNSCRGSSVLAVGGGEVMVGGWASSRLWRSSGCRRHRSQPRGSGSSGCTPEAVPLRDSGSSEHEGLGAALHEGVAAERVLVDLHAEAGPGRQLEPAAAGLDGAGEEWRLELSGRELHRQRAPERRGDVQGGRVVRAVSYTHLRAHETPEHLVCRLL